VLGEARAREIRSEDFSDRLCIHWRPQQTGAPLRENARDLVGIFFGDEVVEACLHLKQRGINRPLALVVRVKMKSCGVRLARFQGSYRREPLPPQTRGNQSSPGTLAEADKKLAPAKIDGSIRLPCPFQNDVPRRVTCGTEANIRVWAGQSAP